MRDPGGEIVAVKVQRPGAEKSIEADISVMRQLAEWVRDYLTELRWMDPPGIVEEFARSIRRELDFTIEASNATALREGLAGFEG